MSSKGRRIAGSSCNRTVSELVILLITGVIPFHLWAPNRQAICHMILDADNTFIIPKERDQRFTDLQASCDADQIYIECSSAKLMFDDGRIESGVLHFPTFLQLVPPVPPQDGKGIVPNVRTAWLSPNPLSIPYLFAVRRILTGNTGTRALGFYLEIACELNLWK